MARLRRVHLVLLTELGSQRALVAVYSCASGAGHALSPARPSVLWLHQALLPGRLHSTLPTIPVPWLPHPELREPGRVQQKEVRCYGVHYIVGDVLACKRQE